MFCTWTLYTKLYTRSFDMSTDCDVHQMLFKGTLFSVPHIHCPYACCYKSDSEVNSQFSSLFTGTDKNMVSDTKITPSRQSAQYDVANDDSLHKNLGPRDVDRKERHHRNGWSKSTTHGSSIAYSFARRTNSPKDNLNEHYKNTAIWPDKHVQDPQSLHPMPNSQDATENPRNIVGTLNHLGTDVKQGNTFWMLKDFWNKRLAKPLYGNRDESNSLSSGSSSPTIESFDARLPLNDDSASCSGDSSGDFDHNGGKDCNGGEDRHNGNYLKTGDQYRFSGQQKDVLVPRSAASMNMLQRDAKMAKNKVIHCPICFKQLKHLYYLRRHMIIHSGVKPFQCNYCPRRFSQTGNRNAHMRIHTGEKPFQCDFCDKKFTHASSKRRHTRFCRTL